MNANTSSEALEVFVHNLKEKAPDVKIDFAVALLFIIIIR